jgi:hypothetical protein
MRKPQTTSTQATLSGACPSGLAQERKELLAATEKRLDEIVAASRRKNRPLRGKEKIGIAIGKSLGRYKMSKHFQFQAEANRRFQGYVYGGCLQK